MHRVRSQWAGLRGLLGGLLVMGSALLTGCTTGFTDKAANGVVFYCPGAGNVDFGDQGVRAGLERAGFRGDVVTVVWTVSLNPAIDQAVRINAKLGGSRLADSIREYYRRYPKGEVNIVGLSAGTGVAVWGLEDLEPKYKVNNVVLLGSSLWHEYDVSKAMKHVRGRMYVYYSPNDAILGGPMKLFGTIDGKFFGEAVGAGQVGLHPPRPAERIVNIAWRPEFERYGYYGGHTDATNAAFVQKYIAPQLLTAKRPATPETGSTTVSAVSAPDGNPD